MGDFIRVCLENRCSYTAYQNNETQAKFGTETETETETRKPEPMAYIRHQLGTIVKINNINYKLNCLNTRY